MVAAAAAIGAGASAAGAPAGFWTNTRLSKPASWVAGKPVTVYCARTQAAIDATVDPSYNTEGQPIQGSTVPGGDEIDLSPLTCAYLDAWLNGRRVVLYNFAVAVETLAHEGELASGISDETTADCKAIPRIPRLVTRFFPLRKRETLHDLMGDVHDAWMSQPAIYHAHPC